MSALFDQPAATSPYHLKAGPAERALTLASGSLLLLPLLGKRSAWRWSAAAAGGVLIYSGLSGTRTASRVLGIGALPATQCIHQSITIGKTAEELFALWRNPDAMTRLIYPLGEVSPFGSEHVRWRLRLPIGKIESEAVLVEETPWRLVHWRSVPNSKLQIDEYMRFRPAPQDLGTVASLEYNIDFSRVPAGEALRALTALFEQAPRSAVRKILHNFKSLAETGEVPTLERNPSARDPKHHGKGDLV